MKNKKIIMVVSNKGGSGKTPIAINIVLWALSQSPPMKVLGIDVNHSNQDFFNAVSNLVSDDVHKTAFELENAGMAYYIPMNENLHLVHSPEYKVLPIEDTIEIITDSARVFAESKAKDIFEPDIIVVDGNYCFPNCRPPKALTDVPLLTFFNIWSITSAHELSVPVAYRNTVNAYKELLSDSQWDKENFVSIFSILEKDRTVTSEIARIMHLQRAMYTVPGSDDLSELYSKIIKNKNINEEGFSFDSVQLDMFDKIDTEIESLSLVDPSNYTQDTINASWVNRINVFLTDNNVFPRNILPMPHFYPFLRKSVTDMIIRDNIEIKEAIELFGDFYKWMKRYMDRYMK